MHCATASPGVAGDVGERLPKDSDNMTAKLWGCDTVDRTLESHCRLEPERPGGLSRHVKDLASETTSGRPGGVEFEDGGANLTDSVVDVLNMLGEPFDYLATPIFGGAHVFFRAGNRTSPKTEKWWWLHMTIAWIVWRSVDAVASSGMPFRAAGRWWVPASWTDGPMGPLYKGFDQPRIPRPTMPVTLSWLRRQR